MLQRSQQRSIYAKGELYNNITLLTPKSEKLRIAYRMQPYYVISDSDADECTTELYSSSESVDSWEDEESEEDVGSSYVSTFVEDLEEVDLHSVPGLDGELEGDTNMGPGDDDGARAPSRAVSDDGTTASAGGCGLQAPHPHEPVGEAVRNKRPLRARSGLGEGSGILQQDGVPGGWPGGPGGAGNTARPAKRRRIASDDD